MILIYQLPRQVMGRFTLKFIVHFSKGTLLGLHTPSFIHQMQKRTVPIKGISLMGHPMGPISKGVIVEPKVHLIRTKTAVFVSIFDSVYYKNKMGILPTPQICCYICHRIDPCRRNILSIGTWTYFFRIKAVC